MPLKIINPKIRKQSNGHTRRPRLPSSAMVGMNRSIDQRKPRGGR